MRSCSTPATNVVRRVSPDGIITTVAGLGGRGYGKGGYSGDGGPANEAELRCPLDAAIDPSSNLFIADRANSVIRRVDPSGVISTFAGGGKVDLTTPSPPSEVPATEARFQPGSPGQIEVDSAGNVLIADEEGHRVWKIDPSGRLAAFAGTGQPGFSGDGGPATEAQLQSPYGLVVDGAGNLYIADQENALIRIVDSAGVIRTL